LAQIAEKTGRAAGLAVGGLIGQVAARMAVSLPAQGGLRNWPRVGRIAIAAGRVVGAAGYAGHAVAVEDPGIARLRGMFAGPELIRRRGSWQTKMRTGMVIIGPGDTLSRIARDLTGNPMDYLVIFPKAFHAAPLRVRDEVPLEMIQGRYRAWSKDIWEAAVVDMK
jgi:hypothetical protein